MSALIAAGSTSSRSAAASGTVIDHDAQYLRALFKAGGQANAIEAAMRRVPAPYLAGDVAEGGGLLSRHISSCGVPNSAVWFCFVGVFDQHDPLFSRPLPARRCQFGGNFGGNFCSRCGGGGPACITCISLHQRKGRLGPRLVQPPWQKLRRTTGRTTRRYTGCITWPEP